MKLCPKCNSQIDENYNFCPSCGYDLQKTTGKQGSAQNASDKLENRIRNSNKVVVCDVCGEETSTGKGYCESCGVLLTGKEKAVAVNEDRETTAGDNVPPVKKEQRESNSKPAGRKPEVKKVPSGNKPKPVQSHGQQKQSPVVEVKGAPGKAAITPVQIALLIIGLLAVGLLVLDMTGVFDSKPHVSSNVQQNQQNDNTQPAVSMEQLNAINTMENEVRNDSTDINKVLQLAHLLNDSGFYERAINYYRMYLRRNPKDADVLVDMGVCYYNLKDYITAKSEMRRGLRINPKHQIANFNLGIVSLSAGDIDSAKIWWQKAIDLDPDSKVGKQAKELLNSH